MHSLCPQPEGAIAGQIGTAFAVRSQRGSLRSVGIFTNRYLLGAIATEIVLAAVFVYTAPMQALLGTAALPIWGPRRYVDD